MICPSCGYKGIEAGDIRCDRCGRKLEVPPPLPASAPPAASYGAALPASQAAPEWKQQVSQQIERYQQRRARQQHLFAEQAENDNPEVVPAPDLKQKLLSFEDIAPSRIEPVVVEPAVLPKPPARQLPPLKPPRQRPKPQEQVLPLAEPSPADFVSARAVACAHPVAPLPLRAVAGALDLAVSVVALGIFFGMFHLLGGTLQLNRKTGVGLLVASAAVAGFYFFLYTFYAAETPGLQWMGLQVLDLEGSRPQAGQRLVRAVGVLLSAAALGFGYLWALADEEGLTWHDRMSRTFVTHDESAPGRARWMRHSPRSG